jgi:hypothetical protein
MRAWACGLVVGLGLAAGCDRGGGGGEGKFVPAQANAREALEAALTRWKDGQAQPGEIPVGKVKVQVIDQAWAGGLKLQGYEITGEESGNTGPRIFNVKLKTAKGEQATKFYVVGIDPLWVYGEADYKKLTGS